MKFFGRNKEISELQETNRLSEHTARFTIVTGRRRSGKTSLLLKAYEDVSDMLYFFVARKSEAELCKDFITEITEKLQIPILGEVARFADIFKFLMQLSKTRHLTVVIDEFQDFKRVNPSVFSDMQKIWDLNKAEAHINLVVCGSIYSLMNVIFKGSKEPLYGRQTGEIKVTAFPPSTIREILACYNPSFTAEDLLALYLYTGGVAEYVEMMMDSGATNKTLMMEKFVCKNSYFINEGKNMLIEEFGRDYTRYFEILQLIASGHTTRSELESIMKTELAGYITKLENDYSLISRNMPMFQKSNRNIRYQIEDNFLRVWFRYIYKYSYMLEVGANGKLKALMEKDYTTYSGRVLERYFRSVMIESEEFTRIASWWDRKGENEIDIIAADELEQRVTFYEVKRQAKDINIGILKDKAVQFFNTTGSFQKFSVDYKGLSLDDI
ncbi:MAG: ATP-binding protein [Prevotella sp.]|nr:ATP-binding protein [Prevotella sp.]MDY3073085.1 ATP-binding protein [Prevotella sp.]